MMLSGKLEKLKKIIPDMNKINLESLTNNQIETLNNIYEFYFENNNNFPTKKELRKIFKEKRDNIPKEVIKEKSDILCTKFLESSYYKNAETIFCFVSFNNEIITEKILKKTLNDKKRLCVPVMSGKEILACLIENIDTLSKNKFGILEPTSYNIVDKNNIDITIVPALIFNPLGFRLGYGGGYYDKFLADYKNLSIGLIFSEFCINYFIPQKFDKKVDIIYQLKVGF